MRPVLEQHLSQKPSKELAVVEAKETLEVVGTDHGEVAGTDLGGLVEHRLVNSPRAVRDFRRGEEECGELGLTFAPWSGDIDRACMVHQTVVSVILFRSWFHRTTPASQGSQAQSLGPHQFVPSIDSIWEEGLTGSPPPGLLQAPPRTHPGLASIRLAGLGDHPDADRLGYAERLSDFREAPGLRVNSEDDD